MKNIIGGRALLVVEIQALLEQLLEFWVGIDEV